MARGRKEGAALIWEERLHAALVPGPEQPYRVPENWCWTRVGEISRVVTGNTPSRKKPKYYGGDFPFFKPGDLDAGRHVYDAAEYLTEEGKAISRTIPAQATMVCCIGSIGKCGFSEVAGATNQQINSIVPQIDPLYFYYYCNTEEFVDQLRTKASATTISIVNKSKIERCYTPIPPLSEQFRIADRIENLFGKLEAVRKTLQAVLDGCESRRAAILHKAFTGKLTAPWRNSRNMGMERWQIVYLAEVCTVNPQRADVKNLSDTLEVSFIPMSALSETRGEITAPQTRLLKEVRTGFTNFSEGDILFAKITPCMENGKSAIVGELTNHIGYGSTEFFVLRCGAQLYNRYLYHIVRNRNFRDEAQTVMNGAVGQLRVPKKFLEQYQLHLPPIEEQQKIVQILDRLMEEELQVEANAKLVLAQIDLVKKSILSRAFRGELGTNDPAEASSVELLKQILSKTK